MSSVSCMGYSPFPGSYDLCPSTMPVCSCVAGDGSTEEQRQFQKMAVEFASREMAPHMR